MFGSSIPFWLFDLSEVSVLISSFAKDQHMAALTSWIRAINDYRINLEIVLNINMVAKHGKDDQQDDLDEDRLFEANLIKMAIDLEVLTAEEGSIRLEVIRRVNEDKDKWNMDESLGDINVLDINGNPIPGTLDDHGPAFSSSSPRCVLRAAPL